jgi:hypothetical protein
MIQGKPTKNKSEKIMESSWNKGKGCDQIKISNLNQREVQTKPIKKEPTREEIIDDRINEAIHKYKEDKDRIPFIN